LQAYKIENGAVRALGAGPYRLNPGQDAAWPPAERAYGGDVETPWERARAAVFLLLKLLVPVLLLLTLLLAVYLYADAVIAAGRLPVWGRGVTITIADLVLPGCWTIIHLTNRRYGPAYAFAQLAAGVFVAALTALINPGDIDHWLPPLPALTWRGVLAFFAAFIVANFVAIVAFDAARGPRWWSAPLAASAVAAFVFSGVYYPLAFGDAPRSALVHLLLYLAEGVALLAPYCLLRPAMRPLNGMNGF
jgi:uncharacterized PurR-regulated membrane protein YhhQ (DUF165 family)